MKYFTISWVPRSTKCTIRFFQNIDNGGMYWYNILGDNEGSISHILWLDPITEGSNLLTDNLVALKRENSEPIFNI